MKEECKQCGIKVICNKDGFCSQECSIKHKEEQNE